MFERANSSDRYKSSTCFASSPRIGRENANETHAKHCVARAADFSMSKNNAVFTDEDRLASMIYTSESYSPLDWSRDGVLDNQHPNSGFRFRVETIPHGVPHTFIGGQMISYESSADPLFLGHHSMIDRSFALWQDCKNLEARGR